MDLTHRNPRPVGVGLAIGSLIFYNHIVQITPPLGPAPNPVLHEPPAVLAEPARRQLLDLLADADRAEGLTVDTLTARTGGHANTTRHHLRALVESGLVSAGPGRPVGGRGRPPTAYRVTPEGVVAAGSVGGTVGQEYLVLASAFAERLAAHGADVGAEARDIGETWGAHLVALEPPATGRGEAGVTPRLVRLLRRLGFSPEPAESPAPADDAEADAVGAAHEVLSLRTCPLLDAARRHPEVVCSVHLGLVAGALRSMGASPDGVRLVPFSGPGACTLALPPA